MKKKKQKKPYPRSFARRLTWRIMLRMLIIMGIPTFLIFWVGYALVFVGASEVIERMLKGEYEEVRRITSDVYVASINTVPVIEENLDQPDKLVDLMERMIKTNERIHSCGISFTENYYAKKGRWFCPYAVRRDSTIETYVLGSEGHNYLDAPWFKEALVKEEGYWSKVFFDGLDQQPQVSYIMPIRDKQHRTVAVLGVDISLGWLNDKVQVDREKRRADSIDTWKARNSFYYFMVDTTGTLLIHPDKQRVGRKKFQDYVSEDPEGIVTRILNREAGDIDEMVLDGEEIYIWYKDVKYTDWTICMVLPVIFINVFGYFTGAFFIFLIILGLLVVYFFGRRAIKKAVKPLNQLAESANEVAKGHFDTQLPTLDTHDEIHQLRDSFDEMQRSLILYIDELKTTTAQKSAIENELKIAHDIQMAMLPKTFPPYPERNDLDIYGMLTPAKGVGGDLFDFFIRDEKLFFCIGDVSGKGIPAALVMAVTRSLFRNIASYVSEPGSIVSALNNALTDGNDTNMFVTIFVGVLDLKTGQLKYCNGGHNAPLLVGRDMGTLPCESNLPVGILADFKFAQQEVVIDHQTTIFLFTDGLNEAEDIDHNQFGDMRIWSVAKKLLAENQHTPLNLVYEMHDAIRQFVGEAEQSDDLTMLAVQYKKQEPKE